MKKFYNVISTYNPLCKNWNIDMHSSFSLNKVRVAIKFGLFLSKYEMDYTFERYCYYE